MREFWDSVPAVHVARAESGQLFLVDNFGVPFPGEHVVRLGLPDITEEQYYEMQDEAVEEESNRFQAWIDKIPSGRIPKQGYIYAVICGDKLKLGRTIDTKQRFHAYRVASDNYRELVTLLVDDYVTAEKVLLARFGSVNRNEWFPYTPELEAEVLKYFKELEAANAD